MDGLFIYSSSVEPVTNDDACQPAMPCGSHHFEVVSQGRSKAVGGNRALGKGDTGYTVEELTPGEGWEIREDICLSQYRRYP